MRTIVDLPKGQIDALAELCRVKKISRAEAVRQAVDGFLKEAQPPAPEIGFGLWKDRKLDSRKIVDRLRSEWDR